VKIVLRLEVYRQSVNLGVKPLETRDQTIFFSQLNCCNSPYVTSSLLRRWFASYEYAWSLPSNGYLLLALIVVGFT
jgi:hypothetical protein